MKPIAKDIAVSSHLGGEEVMMDFDPGSIPHLMNMFIDMYTDQQGAVIREYSTNARDSHVEAGVNRPIEVFLPKEDLLGNPPEFRVVDYGTGMNKQDIIDTYSRYGASTKRESDDFNGTLGLGCKSALTYAPQFSLIGVKDGVATTVVVSRDENGVGKMTVVDEHETERPNGVEIIVPCNKHNQFAQKAEEFFSYWPKGSVLVDGKEPQRVEGLEVGGPDLLVVEGNYKNRIVMGGVAYPADFYNADLNDGYSLVAFVDIGFAEFVPNREGLLEDSKTNKATIADIERFFRDNIGDAVQKQIDRATTRADALATMVKFRGVTDNLPQVFNWQGEELPREFRITNGVLTAHNSHKLSYVDRRATLGVEVWGRTFWITGWDKPTFTPAQKKKLKQWARETLPEGTEISRNLYALVRDGDVPEGIRPWIAQDKVIDWATIDAIKLPRPVSAGRVADPNRIKGSYDMFIDGEFKSGVPAADIDLNNPVYYTESKNRGHIYSSRLAATVGDFTLVELTRNRVEKFKRDFPEAKPVEKELQKLFNAWKRTVSPKSRRALSIRQQYSLRNALKLMSPTKVDDPDIKLWIYAQKRDISKIIAEQDAWRSVGFYFENENDDPFDKYPLFDYSYFTGSMKEAANRKSAAHMYAYLNAIYNAGLTIE